MKKIFFDCQIFQTEAYNRGMGKYSISLLTELFKQQNFKNNYQTFFIFNENLELPDPRKKFLLELNDKAQILEIDLPTNLVENTTKKYKAANKQLTTLVGSKTNPSEKITFVILAPFFIDFASAFPDGENVYKISLVYDLIPQLIWKKQHIFPDDLYFNHYRLFFEANKLLTISESVRNDLIGLIGLPKYKVRNISGGPFTVNKVQNESAEDNYILFPSAPIFHKNNLNAVKGFNKFNKAVKGKYELLITSNFDPKTQESLRRITSQIEFTGTITDEKMAELYLKSSAVLFASFTEGLGMPVLESVLYNKPVACSRIPVLKEISQEAFYFFDPSSPESIASSLNSAVKKEDWKEKSKLYEEVKVKYSWKNSARILGEELLNEVQNTKEKPTINIVCEDPRSNSPAAKLAEKIYAELYEKYDVRVKFTSFSRTKTPSFLPYITNTELKKSPTVFVTTASKKPNNFGTKDVHIAVPNKFQTLVSFTSTYRPNFLLSAKKLIANKSLGIEQWQYWGKNHSNEETFKKGLLDYLVRMELPSPSRKKN